MKSVVILGDGMADHKIRQLGNKTVLDVANKPNIDMLCALGEIGLAKTVPQNMKPGSDNANLAVMGYDPYIYYTGRSPLEAASMGVPLKKGDVAIRMNLVTLSEDEPFEEKIMVDYSAGDITNGEASELVKVLKPLFDNNDRTLFEGLSYRHCLKIENFSEKVEFTPPHDISDKAITEYLPKGDMSEELITLYKKAYEILSSHPINLKRKAEGKNPANCCWLWGMGTKPELKNYKEKYNVNGAVISAVDLIKGIGILSGMEIIEVEGATGNIDTNFEGKAAAAIDALKRGKDYVYVHIEAPDEAGHHGDVETKIKSVELIDKKVVKPISEYLKSTNEPYNILIMPDHPTPIALKTHVNEPVPFVLYRSYDEKMCGLSYNEDNGKKGKYFDNGWELCSYMLNGR